MKKSIIPIALVALLVGIALRADGERANTTDREVKASGERMCDCEAAVSCRFGSLANAGKVGQYISASTAYLMTTLGQGLPIYVFKNNPDLVRAFQQFKEKDEVTVFGVVKWSRETGSYLLANGIQKGFSLDYDAAVPAPATITLDIGGSKVTLAPGQSATVVCLGCGRQILVKWEK